jgi:hypothetical protein
MPVDSSLRDLVRTRARDRCEYCRIHQDDDPFFRFHIEHIVPRKHGGATVEANLAFSCQHCNLHKGANLTGVDPLTGDVVALFDPRKDQWNEHFAWRGIALMGLTPTGRATVRVLVMNARDRMDLRSLAVRGVEWNSSFPIRFTPSLPVNSRERAFALPWPASVKACP